MHGIHLIASQATCISPRNSNQTSAGRRRPRRPRFPKSLLTKRKDHGRKLGLRDDYTDGNKRFKEPGRRGRRCPEEP